MLVGEIDVSYYRNHTERHMLAVPYTYYTGARKFGRTSRDLVVRGALLQPRTRGQQRRADVDAETGRNHWLKLMGGWNIENMDYTSTLGQNTGVIDPEHPSLSLTDGRTAQGARATAATQPASWAPSSA